MKKLNLLVLAIVASGILPLSALTDAEKKEFAVKYAPLVRMHPKDESSPTTPKWYWEKVPLWYRADADKQAGGKVVIPAGKVTAEVLAGVKDKYAPADIKDHYYLSPEAGVVAEVHKGQGYQLVGGKKVSSAEGFVNIVEQADAIKLIYIFFYPYQGGLAPISPLKHITSKTGIGIHEGDWEHVHVFLKKQGSEWKPDKLFYGRHGQVSGDLIEADKAEWVNDAMEKKIGGTHPVVYSALNSHGSYPDNHPLIPTKDADITSDTGPYWPLWRNLVVVPDKDKLPDALKWTTFRGRWGGTLDTTDIKKAEIHGSSPDAPFFTAPWYGYEKETARKLEINQFRGWAVPVAATSMEKRKKGDRFSDFFQIEVPARMINVEYRAAAGEKMDLKNVTFDLLERKKLGSDRVVHKDVTVGQKLPLPVTSIAGLVKQAIAKGLYIANVRGATGPFKVEMWGIEA